VLDGFGLVVLDGFARANLDSLWPHRFWQFAYQIDLQKPILKRGILDLHEIGEAKASLEIAGCDSTMHIVVVGLLALAACHDKGVLIHRDTNLVRLEASNRQRNAVPVFASPQDVVRGASLPFVCSITCRRHSLSSIPLTDPEGVREAPTVTALPDGGFVIAWQETGADNAVDSRCRIVG
jgi:hypothetical protein